MLSYLKFWPVSRIACECPKVSYVGSRGVYTRGGGNFSSKESLPEYLSTENFPVVGDPSVLVE